MTGVGLHGGFRGNSWYKNRVEVFKEHTLKSLINQSKKDFVVWMSFRREEASNPLTDELSKALKNAKIKYVFTFDGLPYWDDKFTEFTSRTIVRNFLMMVMDCWRNKEWRSPFEIFQYSFENKNRTLPQRLKNSVKKLQKYLPKVDWVYLTRIDSDDMFHKNAIELIQSVEPKEKRALTFDKGYVLNKQTGQVADWNPKTNPPFHTIIFPTEDFFNPILHQIYYGDYRSHESIPHVFNAIKLPNKKYCYVVNHRNISTYWNTKYYLVTTGHGTNIGTRWNTSWLGNAWLKWKHKDLKITQGKHPFIGKEYNGIMKEKILKQFGL